VSRFCSIAKLGTPVLNSSTCLVLTMLIEHAKLLFKDAGKRLLFEKQVPATDVGRAELRRPVFGCHLCKTVG